jgi:hypothetical protein
MAFLDTISSPVVFAGDDTCLTVGLLAGLRTVRSGRPLLVVDGANAFDPFLVADLAQKSGLEPKALLDQIRISRVFTCHQLEALLRERLQAAVQQFQAPAVYFSGLLDPLLSDEAPAGEAIRIFRLVIPALRRLAGAGIVTLVACPPPQHSPGRAQFFPALCAAAEWVFQVARVADRDAVQITCTKPQAATWLWEPQIGMIAARRWW